MPARKGLTRQSNSDEKAALRERALIMLAAFEREDPSPTWPRLRALMEGSSRLSDLRALLRECRAIMGAMSPSGRRALERELRERFGADPEAERDLAIIATVRSRGRIRSEREYRAVQAFQDSIATDLERQEEFLVLGALLDEFSVAP